MKFITRYRRVPRLVIAPRNMFGYHGIELIVRDDILKLKTNKTQWRILFLANWRDLEYSYALYGKTAVITRDYYSCYIHDWGEYIGYYVTCRICGSRLNNLKKKGRGMSRHRKKCEGKSIINLPEILAELMLR